MSFNRRERILEHQKQPRVTESVGIPNENEGEEGEQRYVRLSNSLFLYVKSGGRWYNTSTGQPGTRSNSAMTGGSISAISGSFGGSGSSIANMNPNYDSGWLTTLALNDYETVTHSLSCLIPLTQVLFKDGSGKIHHISGYQSVDHDRGIGWYYKDVNSLVIYSCDDHFVEYENLEGSGVSAVNSGSFRVLCWNTGISE